MTPQQEACIPRVEFKLIPIKDLVSNQNYQRQLSENHILNAVRDFDIYQVNAVKVSRRDGINYVFDGQHTIEIIASKSGSRDTPVWCMIYDDLQYQTEAHIFAEQQKHVKSLIPYEIFTAHMEAGDELQLMIDATVRSYNLEIKKTATSQAICAVSTLEKIFTKYGFNVMDQSIRLLVATWEGEKNSLSGSMLMAVARMIVAYGDQLKEDVFKDHVGRVSVKSIARTAKERRPGALGYAEAMVLAYNTKNKYRLSMRKLYGGKGDPDEEDTEDEQGELEQ